MNSQKELFDKLSLACSRKTTLLYSTSFSLAIKLLSKEYQKASLFTDLYEQMK